MKLILLFVSILCMTSCVNKIPEATLPPPAWKTYTSQQEIEEYKHYFTTGSARLKGQAFIKTNSDTAVKLSGQILTIDPATEIGNEWWTKAGIYWAHRSLPHPSPVFLKARRTTIIDADGRFEFDDLPAGKYYVRTQKAWCVAVDMDSMWNPLNNDYIEIYEGGILGQLVELQEGRTTNVILCEYPTPDSRAMWWHPGGVNVIAAGDSQVQNLAPVQGVPQIDPAPAANPAPGAVADSGHMVAVTCSYCKGSGKDPSPTSVANFGLGNSSNKRCEVCGKFENHYHKQCPSCHGKGTVQKFVP